MSTSAKPHLEKSTGLYFRLCSPYYQWSHYGTSGLASPKTCGPTSHSTRWRRHMSHKRGHGSFILYRYHEEGGHRGASVGEKGRRADLRTISQHTQCFYFFVFFLQPRIPQYAQNVVISAKASICRVWVCGGLRLLLNWKKEWVGRKEMRMGIIYRRASLTRHRQFHAHSPKPTPRLSNIPPQLITCFLHLIFFASLNINLWRNT